MRFKANFHKNPKAFKDNFSTQSEAYATNRPLYPDKLFRYLSGECREHKLAWDAGTGNGQAAQNLALHFEKVYATDASSSQIINAVPQLNITYAIANEQAPVLKSRSVDLITAAQALHWFDLDVFYSEAERVLKKYGVLACWSYKLFRINQDVDREIDCLYKDILGNYWDPERRLVDTAYRTLSFPFREFRAPCFEMKASWDFENMLGLLSSWSAVSHYKKREGHDPISEILERLNKAWGDPQEMKEVRWDLSIRVGSIR
ncbi:MAG: class I SAM-dependent methyltransferase [SAR324 cluster bacterium]|nr:class I SAM-dependent methyltransferase [SAR324 cluster bacterium]MBL7034134.1 class I SAM-dependent methyltransferase [SAR324 cluster bacterium]